MNRNPQPVIVDWQQPNQEEPYGIAISSAGGLHSGHACRCKVDRAGGLWVSIVPPFTACSEIL